MKQKKTQQKTQQEKRPLKKQQKNGKKTQRSVQNGMRTTDKKLHGMRGSGTRRERTVVIIGSIAIVVALILNPWTIIRAFRLEAMHNVIIPFVIICELLLAGAGILFIVFRSRVARKLPEIALAAGTTLFMLVLFEACFTFVLHHPAIVAAMPPFVQDVFRAVYMQDRHLIAFDPACGQYDEEFFYTLKPGVCTFENIEFKTTYRINSAGFRDDEDSLAHPVIAAIGDSTTMGWGVEQDETFAQIIENETGLKTVNTGVGSYGTVREVMTLGRVGQDALKYVIVQYDPNDIGENLYFLENSKFENHTAEEFAFLMYERLKDEKTYFGKNTLLLIYRFLSLFSPPKPYPRTDEVKAFLNALTLRNWTGLRVFVLTWDPTFGRALKQELDARPRPYLTVVDISDEVNATHHFVLDDHLNAAGHRLAAERLIAAIEAADR